MKGEYIQNMELVSALNSDKPYFADATPLAPCRNFSESQCKKPGVVVWRKHRELQVHEKSGVTTQTFFTTLSITR